MNVILNNGDIIMVRNSIYCYLVQKKTIKQITWKSFLKLSGYKMIDLKSEFWGMSARNFVVNGHYQLEINFIV
ncbi:hypothetical protein ACUH7Y_09730 [Clostridium beijerinckii]|uniref:Uncharacterized protein n=1 Tax=Clostridium beijerinckii TaxID=1520 RepID=A0A7X9XP40_CLOBE|nr:hypothetical protein [Clostridium beijerinckii]NMF04591.1 hypothetical protein [Clostridium beijerinckii]